MKKRIILSIVFLLLFVGLIIYSVIFSYGEAEPLDLAENITMEIKEGTLTNKGATVVITDLSGNENTYNNEFRLDRKKNGRWHKMVKEDPVIVTPGATGKDENNKVEIELNFETYYGIIEDGHYRIVKEINDKDIAVEFDLITLKDN